MNPRKKQDRNYKPGNKPNVDRTQPRGGSDRKVYRPRKEEESIRINRYIAQAGICSRRKADELIEEGRVKVNGEIVVSPGVQVKKGDTVEVGGRVVTPQGLEYLLLNKPEDAITTRSDEKGRKTVLDLIDLPETEKNALFPVGRLDRNTRGVLLITNDGELANRLMHPRYEIEKVYRVRTSRPVKQEDLDRLKKGVDLEDGPAHADEIDFADTGDACDVVLLIHEGRNRQVRRMFEQIGHEVGALERVSYAGLTTQGVRRGKWRRLYPHEIRRLRSLVKLK